MYVRVVGTAEMITSAKTRRAVVGVDAPAPTVMAMGIANVRHNGAYSVDLDDSQATAPTEKPSYRVPGVSEIDAIKPNGYTVVSTFSGCGGSCLGFRLAGYRVLWASEFVDAAAATYAANAPETPLDRRDIRDVTADEILSTIGRERGDVDVLEGSPPCASFSTAGKRAASWGQVKPYSDVKQRVDDLFFEYARLVDGLRPRIFVAENVSGLVKGVAKGYFKEILRALRAPGYVVAARLLDAQWLGVPQARQRIIFIGVRADLVERYGVGPAFPTPLPYRYSVRDALPELAAVDGRTGPGFARTRSEIDAPMNAILVTDPAQTRYEVMLRADLDQRGAFGNGGDCTETPAPTVLADSAGTHWVTALRTKRGDRSLDQPAPTIQTHNSPFTQSEATLVVEPENGWDAADRRARRVDPGEPSPTILHHGRGWNQIAVAEPVERRKFTIAELRRICGFPDDFVLTGTYAQQWERLGRAVPPPMIRAVAETVRDTILARCRDDGP